MTLDQFKELNKNKGFKDFNKDAMSFWGSKVCEWSSKTGLFITSEDNFDRSKKLFTIRCADLKTGKVRTVGYFQDYATLHKAKKAFEAMEKIKELAK